MSITYYGLPVHDASAVGGIVEGRDTMHTIDEPKVRAALQKTPVRGKDTGQLKWQSGNDYVFVDVLSNHVLVTHNAGRGSAQLAVMMDVLDALRRAGLHVYDPQQGDWFFRK
jgi:hypothetical protein